VDTHVDTTQRLFFDGFDLGARASRGCVDIPRLREGGIGAVFFAVWVPGTITGAVAVASGFRQIAAIRRQLDLHAADLALARTTLDIHAARRAGKIALLMGLEGGHMINCDLNVLRQYADVGIRYMTLTHSLNHEWCDSATDAPVHGGLSEFGREVLLEMNRLGLIVDVSHISDEAFYQTLATSAAPVIASHSACRALCDSPRNLTDDMIRALAAHGGVLQITFHTGFISQKFRDAMLTQPQMQNEIEQALKAKCGENQACQLLEHEKLTRGLVHSGKLPRVPWTEIISHIHHAVQLVGPDHVGLGSDFDGANMPWGLEDASRFPQITEALLQKGYSDGDIHKILGGSALRLMQDVDAAVKISKGRR